MLVHDPPIPNATNHFNPIRTSAVKELLPVPSFLTWAIAPKRKTECGQIPQSYYIYDKRNRGEKKNASKFVEKRKFENDLAQ